MTKEHTKPSKVNWSQIIKLCSGAFKAVSS